MKLFNNKSIFNLFAITNNKNNKLTDQMSSKKDDKKKPNKNKDKDKEKEKMLEEESKR
jgi:hypothetical protein